MLVSLFNFNNANAEIDIQPGLSGTWIADDSGQGVLINIARVNDAPNFIITWYAYMSREPIWLIGSQPFDYGIQQLTIPMTLTSGANWGNDFVADDVIRTQWGSITVSFSDCDKGNLQYNSNDENFGSGEMSLIRLTNTDGLSCHEDNGGDNQLTEAEGLKFMREEEKMARDVYLVFYDMYGKNTFINIAASEQTHMDAILNLMYVYDIPDTSTGVEGTFNNPDLQDLYDALIAMGTPSLVDALLAAALIEETDIRDIELFKQDVTSQDILNTYDNLLCGSRNHMRSFVSQYESEAGLDYQVQIPEMEDAVNEILSSGNEQCGQQ